MKTPLKALLTVMLAIAAISTVAFASTGIFTITNHTTNNVGIIAVNFTSGAPAMLPVPGQGSFSTPVSSTPVSITVNGTVVPRGAKISVVLATGAKVTVNYTDPSGIPIVDPNEVF